MHGRSRTTRKISRGGYGEWTGLSIRENKLLLSVDQKRTPLPPLPLSQTLGEQEVETVLK